MSEEKADFEQRCYPSTSDIQVYRYLDKPPAYEIRAGYEGVRGLLEDLQAPSQFNKIYCVKLSSAEEFFKKGKLPSKRFLNYAIERFGLKIRVRGDVKNPIIPDSLIYVSQPSYWTETSDYLVQVWRTRIFALPVERIVTSLSKPLSLPKPLEIYFEETWHPTRGKARSLHWIYNRHRNNSKIEQFKRDALCILDGIPQLGRPRGPVKYSNPDEFIHTYEQVYRTLAKNNEDKVGQELVASKMGISVSTLQRRLKGKKRSDPPQ